MPVLQVLGTVWLWSLIPIAVKVAHESFNFAFIAFSRMALGTLIFAIVELGTKRGLRFPPREKSSPLPGPAWLPPRGWALIAGIGIGADLLLYTLGLRYTSASAATLIVSTDGVILALLAVLVLGERMSRLKAGAGAAALAGLLLVGWNGQDLSSLLASEYLLGNVLVLAAACCWSLYGLGQRVLARTPGGSLFPIFLIGTAIAGVVALFQPPVHAEVDAGAVLALLYLGLGGTGLAYILLVRGMAHLEAATVGLLGSTLPLFTMVEANLALGEQITLYLLGGAGMIIIGVALVMRHERLYGVRWPDESGA